MDKFTTKEDKLFKAVSKTEKEDTALSEGYAVEAAIAKIS